MQDMIKYLGALVVGGLLVVGLKWFTPSVPPRPKMDIGSQLLKVSESGDLVALTASFKEIVEWHTKSNETYKGKKMLLVVACDTNFRFPLRELEVSRTSDNTYALLVPSCVVDCDIKDVHIYDEQPGVKFGTIPIPITTDQRNAAIKQAHKAAKKAAMESKDDLVTKAEASAKRTLATICQGLGLTSDQYTIEIRGADIDIEPSEKPLEALIDRKIKEHTGK
jgi:hypothetical protein